MNALTEARRRLLHNPQLALPGGLAAEALGLVGPPPTLSRR